MNIWKIKLVRWKQRNMKITHQISIIIYTQKHVLTANYVFANKYTQ